MSPLTISLLIGGLLVAGATAGVALRRVLPDSHLDAHTKDVVRLGCGLIATISGLVLGLLINSAKTTFETQRDEVKQVTANVILLDQALERFGPESRDARLHLRKIVPDIANHIWRDANRRNNGVFYSVDGGERIFSEVRHLPAVNEDQHFYQALAVQALTAILQTRVLLFEQEQAPVPGILLGILVFWLVVLFVSFSLFSPLSPIGRIAIVVFAVSSSAALFLILEMYQPFSGLLQIDSTPLRQALLPLG
ncbi:Protein of unknown function [Enhydrobacter aerosaccus]|uniref:DUF4239 domain-containing protein n=1 Tax=Enhydrobacter aerosaccus TaxID=225324 RepID=A0A1T4SSF0_9HYPH|nr:DUF4239 domain-containing protein [Enhydrobacter aerosaccus]SKA31086.1 Protein of unknown function [Enhydrobacter aerosaccus]